MVGIPMVVVLVHTQQTVIGTYIATQVGIVCTGGMHHNALDGNLATCLVAGILGKNKLMQIHYPYQSQGTCCSSPPGCI